MKLILKKDIPNEKMMVQFVAKFYEDYLNKSQPFTIFMFGGLGVGKTFITREIAKLMGINPSEVISPTYNYYQVYENSPKKNLTHFDLYRLEAGESTQKGLLEDLSNNNIIEWSENLSTTERTHFLGNVFFMEIKHGVGVGMRKVKISQ
jgi:tRNA threonylcarbamoyl adenosine modification protein YjeE